MSVTYTTAHGNAGSFTHWVRPGIEPTISWFLVEFVNHRPTMETLDLLFLRNVFLRVPAVVQWDQRHLGSAGMWVWSLTWHSGLRMWYGYRCGLGHNYNSDLILGLGIRLRGDKKRKKKVFLFFLFLHNLLNLSLISKLILFIIVYWRVTLICKQ